MATMENLQEAFAGESQANRKYLAFAKKADRDGLPQVAKLFRASARNCSQVRTTTCSKYPNLCLRTIRFAS